MAPEAIVASIPSMQTVLALEGVSKAYRRGPLVNDQVTLNAQAGQVYGILGHNGAGKTTLVNQVVGLLKPDAGTISIHGHDVVADPAYARRACSVEPQSHVPIDGMSPRQAIGLVGRLRGGSPADVRRRMGQLIDALEIGEWADTDGARLSGGVKRLVSFCMAAVIPGRVVILDEPTNDVDPVRRRHLWGQVRALGDEGAAVLLVTHNVIEAERSVDRLGILDHGRMIIEGTPAELKATVSQDLHLELVLGSEVGPPMPAFVRRSAQNGHRVTATVASTAAAEAAAWAQALHDAGGLEEFSLAPTTLEDVYIDIVERAEAARTPDPARDARPVMEAADVPVA